MEHAARKELEQRLGATHRPVAADSSAGVSLGGFTEHSAERSSTSGVAAPERSMMLKRKASATKCTLADKAGPYQSSVSYTQCSADVRSSQQSTKKYPVHWTEVKLQTFFTVPGNAIHYFCVVVPEEAGEDVTDKRGRPKCQLIDGIKEQWAHEKEQQENMQKVLADGASRHETTN